MILVNGEKSATISVLDRGLAYGDGVFRTLALREGELQCWGRHYAKLSEDCARLALPVPDRGLLREECTQAGKGNLDGVVKIVVTRGQGRRGYAIPDPVQPPTRIVMYSAFPQYPEENQRFGIRVRICQIRLAEQPMLAGIKHLNRLENVLARAEWDDPAIIEGLLLDTAGNAIEGVMSNLFMVKNNILVTPDLRRCGVAGVTRERILDWAGRIGMKAEIRPVPLGELLTADACFLCNSLIGVWQIRELEMRRWELAEIVPKIRHFLAERHV